jgi:hypothetical protein
VQDDERCWSDVECGNWAILRMAAGWRLLRSAAHRVAWRARVPGKFTLIGGAWKCFVWR